MFTFNNGDNYVFWRYQSIHVNFRKNSYSLHTMVTKENVTASFYKHKSTGL